MGKLVYQEPADFFVQVSVCSINSFLNLNPFSLHVSEENLQKIETVLNNSTTSKFILFPEYTYTPDLYELYRNFSNANRTVIVGGSGLEEIGENYYAFSPVFIPGQDMIKVYKKNITNDETVYSEGRIIAYPNDVLRQISVEENGNIFLFSVYVCYDFLIEHKGERTDIVFVPQYENSPQLFINEGDRISKGMKNFVLGANNANNNQRSLGFAILNSQLINALAHRHWRPDTYPDADGNVLDYHHTIFYDIQGERLIKFRLNIGKPFSLPYTYDLLGQQPIIIPISELNL